jgi:hypothetical protein
MLSWMYMCLHVKYRYSCEILMTFEFSQLIFKNSQMSNLMEIRTVWAELFREDRHDEANGRFSQFCERD